MHLIDWHLQDQKVRRVLFDDIVRIPHEIDKHIAFWTDETNSQNLPEYLFFEGFKNTEEIEIQASSYPFSLLSLLSRIQITSVNKVVIFARKEIWSELKSRSSFRSILNAFSENQFAIKIDRFQLIISRSRSV